MGPHASRLEGHTIQSHTKSSSKSYQARACSVTFPDSTIALKIAAIIRVVEGKVQLESHTNGRRTAINEVFESVSKYSEGQMGVNDPDQEPTYTQIMIDVVFHVVLPYFCCTNTLSKG